MERSNLAALEFLMSKQPRGNVRVGMGNATGISVSNIFVEVKKFQTRFQDAKERAAAQSSNVGSTFHIHLYIIELVDFELALRAVRSSNFNLLLTNN